MIENRRILSLIIALTVMITSVFTLNINTAEASTGYFSVEDLTVPTVFEEGQSVDLEGIIKSKYKMTYAKIGIVNEKQDWIKKNSIEVKPNKTSYNLKSINSKLDFSKLKVGTYYFKVRAKDEKKHIDNAVLKAFVVKEPPAFQMSDETIPTKTHVGNPFTLKGKIKSYHEMKEVYVGITDTKGQWKKGYYTKVNPKSTNFDINKVDSKVKISKLVSGVYKYKVTTKDIKNRETTLVDEQFTVSKLKVEKESKPTVITKGRGFGIVGIVKSKFTIVDVKVGVVDKKGDWQPDTIATASPEKTGYDIKKLDAKVQFDKLDEGDYKYKVIAEDKYGIDRTLVDQSFKVVEPEVTPPSPPSGGGDNTDIPTSAVGKKLRYNADKFYAIGKQPFSGPCGLYAMAYGRLVMDGDFDMGGYSSYYDKLRAEYGMNSDSAHWGEAGAGSVYSTSTKAVAQMALAEIEKGKPVILDLKSGYTGNQHFVLVIGYVRGTTSSNVNSGSFIILDPASGTERLMSDYPLYQIDDVQKRVIRYY
ncbi:MAG: hypothetical protein RR495_01780 [Anaerovoracaceae bacterium]